MQINRNRLLPFLFPALIFCIAFLQYANTIGHDYAWDDKLVINDNEVTRKGIAGIPEIFLKRTTVPNKNVYRPVPQAMFALEYDLFNQSPHAGHFFSVLWYAALCLVVYFFIRFVFPNTHRLLAFFTALLFAVHPLHVEVVANIKSRDETLALLFGLVSLVLFVKFLEYPLRKGMKWVLLTAATISFALAYLSKANAATLLPVALLMVWYRNNVRIRPVVLVGILGIGLALGAVFWLSSSVPADQATGPIEMHATVLNNIFLWTTEPHTVKPTALVNIGRYLGLFVYPHPLIHMYGYNQLSLRTWSSPDTWLVLGLLLATGWYVLRNWKKRDPVVFGLLFAGITYSIYSNLFKLAPDTMADRYLFFPSVGLCLVATVLVSRLGSVSMIFPRFNTIRAKLAAGVILVIILAYGVRTFIGNRDWENDYTLIYNRIGYMQNNAAAQATYGFMLQQESEGTTDLRERRQKQAAAMQAFMRAVDIYPDFYWSWISIGKLFAEQGVYDKAELCFLKAQQLEPFSTDGYFCLGALYYTKGDAPLAMNYLEKTIMMEPSREYAYLMLGKTYMQADSIASLGMLAQEAIKWFPRNAEFTAFMATYFYRTGKFRDAVAYLHAALHQDPRNITARALLSMPAIQSVIHHGDSTRTLVTPAP